MIQIINYVKSNLIYSERMIVMDMGFELQQSQQQRQILSQKMIQAVQILHMNSEELDHYMEEQIIENPVLELMRNYINEREKDKYKSGYKNSIDKSNNEFKYNNLEVTQNPTFLDDLLIQWHVKKNSKVIEEIGEWIINNINDNGYIYISEEEIAEQFNTSIQQAESVLKMIQGLEPAGIACRNLAERLLMQIEYSGTKDKKLMELVENNLNLLAKKKWKIICKDLGISLEELKQYISYIKTLNPIINVENGNQTIYIEPEVRAIEVNGGFEIEYIQTSNINLYIPDYYKILLKNPDIDNNTKEYIKTNFDKAIWLIRNIEERKQNILNISESIIKKQEDFLKYGKAYMRSLTQKEVAEDIGISTSTVSRIVNGKYIDTPQGVYQLKFFFSSGIEKKNDEISPIAVKNKIKVIVEEEEKSLPYSDEKIKAILEKEDIYISRRTVAKYRTCLDILNASQRKQL